MENFVCVSAESQSMEGNESGKRCLFLDLDQLEFLSTEGIDKHGRRILRIVAKFLPAPIIDRIRLKEYISFKISEEIPQEPFCIVYFHAQANQAENCPGILNMRWIYESLPEELRQRLEAVYFVHPGALSKMTLGTLGRFLSNRLYEKVKYTDRLEFLWDDVWKGQIDIPEFVCKHDKMLEQRPLMDYWIEPYAFNMHSWSGIGNANTSRWATLM